MPDEIKVTSNLLDFKRGLERLERAVRFRIVRSALRQAGNIIKDAAKQTAPILKVPSKRRVRGALRRSLFVTRNRKASNRGTEAFLVAVRGKRTTKKGAVIDAFYWRFLEGGWVPRGRGKRLKGGKRYRKLQLTRLVAAGARRVSYPFLLPAAQRSQSAAIAKFNRVMTDGILAEARKQ